ncbi:MAG: hypothetical protein O7I42_10870 [Alphaproteobacteria bacterium]|nr:hypothetical protein [Alphaproteobacteria bacterium]
MNSAYILVGAFVPLVLAVVWLTLHRMGYVIIRRRNELHRPLSEPRTHGDDGGYPAIKGRVKIIPR